MHRDLTSGRVMRLEPLEPRIVLSDVNLDRFEGDAITWIDSTTGDTIVAGVSEGDLVLLAGDGDDDWTHRNLSDELGVTATLGPRLTQWESPNGRAGIAGIDTQGRIVVFQETGAVIQAPPPPTPPVEPTAPIAPVPPTMPWHQGYNIFERTDWTTQPGMIAQARRNQWTGQREIIYEIGVFDNLPHDYKTFVRAHEYGHHVLGHVDLYETILRSGRFDLFYEAEFEADCFAAQTLAIEGGHNVSAAISFMSLVNAPASPTHPANADRVVVIDRCARETTAHWQAAVAAYQAAEAQYQAAMVRYRADYAAYVAADAEYRSLIAAYVPLDGWRVTHVGRDDLPLRGKRTPEFAGSLTSFTLSYGGITVAGRTASGRLEAVWWAPGMRHWDSANLSALTGLSGLEGEPVSFVTSWDGMNIGGLSADGSVLVAWWTPSTNRWQLADLSRLSDAPPLTGGLVSYVTDWGGMNVIGATESGRLLGVWWAPGRTWTASDLSRQFNNTPDVSDGIGAFVEPGGRTNIVARAPGAESFVIWWRPGARAWTGEFVRSDIDDLLWSDYRFGGSGNGGARRGLATIADGSMHWARWVATSEWELIELGTVSRAAVVWPD